jgi:glycosyltransferase involved in cell wall biosynthesis
MLGEEMKQLGICIVIPTYNNQKFLPEVLRSVLAYTHAVIVVNDGSTDATLALLTAFEPALTVVSYAQNRGKGYALNKGLDKARELGYIYAVTMDSDGQHLAGDLPLFVETIRQHPGAMLIGSRKLKQENMPGKNTFANKFSNFWFAVQTGRRLPDTQTGFRLYPLIPMKRMRALSTRYEAELELLVRAAWKNIPQIPIPIQVYYPPKGERITHFRPSVDFLRISLLNTFLCLIAILYGYPSMFFRKLNQLRNNVRL